MRERGAAAVPSAVVAAAVVQATTSRPTLFAARSLCPKAPWQQPGTPWEPLPRSPPCRRAARSAIATRALAGGADHHHHSFWDGSSMVHHRGKRAMQRALAEWQTQPKDVSDSRTTTAAASHSSRSAASPGSVPLIGDDDVESVKEGGSSWSTARSQRSDPWQLHCSPSQALGCGGVAGSSAALLAKVCSVLKARGVHLMDQVQAGDSVLDKEDLKCLSTALHSEEALPFVREHILETLGSAARLNREHRFDIALLQVADTYASSVHFGYWLRLAEKRYQLERLAADPPEMDVTDTRSPPLTFEEYVASLRGAHGQAGQAMLLSAESDSVVAGAIEGRVLSLFGDPDSMRLNFLSKCQVSCDRHEDWEALVSQALHEGVKSGDVPSLVVSAGGLRHLALEGVAFGAILCESEVTMSST